MGALNPLFLAAAAAVAVPLFLHLFQRHRARRLSFPAIRYLERTEREHARRIRFRQLLLLVLRVAILLLLVLAGARLFVGVRGSDHPPTALVVILDNSASSGRVVGERRVLDELKELARVTVDGAGPDDRIWVLRAGEPWTPTAPLPPSGARARVDETEVSAARGDLSEALERAGELVATSDLQAREIHLLSDLQASAFDGPDEAPSLPEGVEVVAWRGPAPGSLNRALIGVLVGGGLPPLVDQRTEVTVSSLETPDSAEVSVRLVVDGRIRGAATAPGGSQATIPLPAVPAGWVAGWVETDPDDLRLDDRRYFAFRARPAPTLAVRGLPGEFVNQAVEVLRAAGRVVPPAGSGPPDLLLAAEAQGLEGAGDGGAALVVPPTDPALLPALNRRLAQAGIPWRYARGPGGGAAPLAGLSLPDPLRGVEARRWYHLSLDGTPATPPNTLAQVVGRPWAVEGETGSGLRYLLLASPLDEGSTSLPVSADMVRFVDWAAGAWAAVGGGPVERPAGVPLTAPREARRVQLPDGRVVPVDGTRSVRATGQVGHYTFLDADSAVVSVQAVNPVAAESELIPLDEDGLEAVTGDRATVVDRADRWDRAIFRSRRGPELWFPLLLGALALLLAEARVASAGHAARGGSSPTRLSTAGTRGATP